MDGLNAGASAIAVISLAVQLVESVKHLYDFWKSIEEAPAFVRDIAKELGVLSAVLVSVANPALLQRSHPNMKLALEICKILRFELFRMLMISQISISADLMINPIGQAQLKSRYSSR